jgi:hypothetical protein
MASSQRRRSSSQSQSHSQSDAIRAMAQAADAANLWLIIAGLYWLILVMGMHLPGESIPDAFRPGDSDGAVHTLAYMVFGFLLCGTFDALHRRRYPAANTPVLIYVFIFLACVTYGYIDEETQPLTGRTADAADWESDVLGSLIGCCLHLAMKIFLTSDPVAFGIAGERSHRRRRHRSRSRSRRSSGDGSETGAEGNVEQSSEGRSKSSSKRRRSEAREGDEHGNRRRRRRHRHRSESPDVSPEEPREGTDPGSA